jgi:hypothetical protein
VQVIMPAVPHARLSAEMTTLVEPTPGFAVPDPNTKGPGDALHFAGLA